MLMMMMLDYVNLLVEYIIISVLILSHKDNYICCLFVVYILYSIFSQTNNTHCFSPSSRVDCYI